jgi:hypothetical protein
LNSQIVSKIAKDFGKTEIENTFERKINKLPLLWTESRPISPPLPSPLKPTKA